MPQYPLPAGVSTEEFLRAPKPRGGLSARFSRGRWSAPPAYRERLERELQVHLSDGASRATFSSSPISSAGAREHGVPVGTGGRGSGAGLTGGLQA